MPISAQCPQCQKVYKLKDELLGKRVTCADKACRTSFEVKPIPPKPVKTAEEIAAAALAEEPDPAQAIPEDLRKIDMKCVACDHVWQVAWAMQGKNALCPECKSRMKVPEQKTGSDKADWRNPNAKRPSLAKQEEVPDDVWGANKANVSVGSLKGAGVIPDVEYEPRPLSFWVKIVGSVAVLLIGVSALGFWLTRSSQTSAVFKLGDAAEKDFESFKDAGVPPVAASQFTALMHLASAEFGVRQKTAAGLKTAMQKLSAARQALQAPAARGGDRHAILTELMIVSMNLGGSTEEVKGGSRIPWLPVLGDRRKAPVTGSDVTVLSELQNSIRQMLETEAEPDLRFAALRRVVRELELRGHTELIDGFINAGFKPEEIVDATAQAALERHRILQEPAKIAEAATSLKILAESNMDKSVPPSALAVWAIAQTAAAPGGSPNRMSITFQKLAENKPAEALAAANAPGPADERLRALALVAEQAANPADAVTAAMALIAAKASTSASNLVRLAAAAGAAENDAAMTAFVAAIPDEGLKAWAQAEALRGRAASSTSSKVDSSSIALPPEAKQFRAGHAWSRFIEFRHNGRVTRDPGLEKQARDTPSGTIRPFALAGLGLGLLDGAAR